MTENGKRRRENEKQRTENGEGKKEKGKGKIGAFCRTMIEASSCPDGPDSYRDRDRMTRERKIGGGPEIIPIPIAIGTIGTG